MGGSGLLQADADLPVVFVDPLDHVSVELELADDWRPPMRSRGGGSTGCRLVRMMIPWLLTAALNHFRNRQRKLSRERKLVERLAAPDLAPPAP